MRTCLHCGPSLTICCSRTVQKLAQGELVLVDNRGDPKLPAFLYDEEITDGSLAQGLLRGPFLLAVSFQHPQIREHH